MSQSEPRAKRSAAAQKADMGLLVSTVAAAFVTLVSFFLHLEFQIALLIALIVFIFASMLSDHFMLFRRFDELEEQVESTKSVVSSLRGVHQIPELEPHLISIVDSLAHMKKVNHSFPSAFARVIMEYTAGRFSAAVATNRFECGPKEEIDLTKALVKTCQKELKAVSFEDVPWWTGFHGDAYLSLHEELLNSNKNVKVTRIFIVHDKDLEKLANVIERHQKLGIETYVLHPKDVPNKFERDFVLYDDILREAISINGGLDKMATFSVDQTNVDEARMQFGALLNLAKRTKPPRDNP